MSPEVLASSLSPLSQVGHNLSFLQMVLEHAAREKRWTNTPIFVGQHMEVPELSGLFIWLQCILGVTSYLFNAAKNVPLGEQLHSHIKSDALSLLFCQNSSEELIWTRLDTRLRKMRRGRLIISLEQPPQLPLFERLWRLQFLNVLVLHSGHIYRYTPYPTVRFFRVEQNKVPLFPTPERDLRGYVVSTPAENDLPRVFSVYDKLTGRRLIRGFGYRIFAEFLHRHNATLNVTNLDKHYSITSNVNMSFINRLIGAGKLEISLHPYIGIEAWLGVRSYPMLKTPNCLIVPVRNEIPRYMYLLRPFQWRSWLLLLGTVFYISMALYWLSPVRQHNRCQRVIRSLMESLTQLLFISTPWPIRAPSLRYFLVALQLFVLGFVVTNWYSNVLGSFLTAILVGEQVDSMEQLVQQKQRILSRDYEVDMVLEQVPNHLRQQVARLVVSDSASEQMTALLSFNRSYAYPFTEERWQFFSKQQQYANKPIYRFSSVCLGSPNIGYSMRNDSHLEEKLNLFTMQVQSNGLLQYWLVSDFKDALEAGYMRLLDNQLAFKALDLDTLRLAWLVLAGGLLLAFVTFVCERLAA